MTVEQLKAHPFFYGVDWATIREIDAPFVPHLRSITDTSYFPTEELDQVPEIPQGAESGPDAKKDLAFLGYTWVSLGVPACPDPRAEADAGRALTCCRFRRYEML